MKRLLVHLHLYYAAQCDYFVEKLQNISGCEWKLFVTMPVYYKKEAEILKNAHEQTEIIITENYGADIWPFIKLIQETDLNEYDYILKLHTKSYNPNGSRVNGIWYKGYECVTQWSKVILKTIPLSSMPSVCWKSLQKTEWSAILYFIKSFPKEHLRTLSSCKKNSNG